MHEYKCKILRIVDGDTVDVDIDLGFGIWRHKERVRLLGIDTPESRTRDLEEKKFGLLSKQYVKDHYPIGSIAMLRTHKDKTGKFGRILGDFIVADGYGGYENGALVTEIMIAEGHAVPYTGGSKEEIEAKHLENRERLIAEGVVTL